MNIAEWENRFERGTWNRAQLRFWIDLFAGLVDYYEAQLAAGEFGPEMIAINQAVQPPLTLDEYQAMTQRLLVKARGRLELANGRLLALAN